MAELKKEMIGGIGIPVIKDIINSVEQMGIAKVNKHPLSDLPNFAYKLFVEFDSETKVAKNLVIEIEK